MLITNQIKSKAKLTSELRFYPLYPPAQGVNLDSSQIEQLQFGTHTPHIIITPSDLTHFVKVFNPIEIRRNHINKELNR